MGTQQAFTKTAMAALWDEVAETTSINLTLSRSLEKWGMDELSEMGRTAAAGQARGGTTDAARLGNAQDVEWIPQEYRFTTRDGIVSSDSDFEDIIDRNIPVYRNRAKRILARINTRDLRDPMRRQKKMQGMSRDIANAIDIDCYQTMINQSTMIVRSTNAFTYQDPINAEVLMLNRGLSAFDRNLYLANKDYAAVASSLGQNQYYGREGDASIPRDALVKAMIPPLATFETMRSDYLIQLPANSTSGITVNDASGIHEVATYDSDGFYLDNRSQELTLSGISATTFPVGTKFTIADVNALHEETREDTGDLQTFTVVSAHATTPRIQPAIVATGPYRNCVVGSTTAETAIATIRSTLNGNAITILNTANSNPSLFYTPESTVLIPGRLPVPQDAGGVEVMEATTEQGLPMRFTYWYDPHNELFQCKVLVFYDVQVIYPNMLGCIITSQT